MIMKKIIPFILVMMVLVGLFVPSVGQAFAQKGDIGEHGLVFGFWHGLLAPYSLIARFFVSDVVMYYIPNDGLGYDIGFLIGMIGSIPAGWLAALVSVGMHIFVY